MAKRFEGKAALVTGAGSGIGAETARRLAEEGAAVLLTDRSESGLDRTRREIDALGTPVETCVADVGDGRAVEQMVGKAVEAFGGLDLALNGAGIEGAQVDLPEQDDAVVAEALRTMVHGLHHCLKREIPAIIANGGGAIVNISGTMGIRALPTWSPYVAAKHAVSGMTRAAALEFARRGVRINAVAPGPIMTPMLDRCTGGDTRAFAESIPMGRVGAPHEVANAALWLLSDEASYITGHILPVDGGVLASV